MQSDVKKLVHDITEASDESRIVFPDVVKGLTRAGVERYHANLIDGTRTYYMPDDSFEVVQSRKTVAPAATFLPEKVENAVRTIQRGEIDYREFCDRIAAAGCVGYFVSLAGRRAQYYGRTNETYTELFPGTT